MSTTDELHMTLPSTDDAYAAWRTAADEAAEALRDWIASPGLMRDVAYRAYVRSLDREEERASALERARRATRLLWWHR